VTKNIGDQTVDQERVPVVTVDGKELSEHEAQFVDIALRKYRTVYEQIVHHLLYGSSAHTEEPVGLLGSFKELEG
jgi:hypothetical protein